MNNVDMSQEARNLRAEEYISEKKLYNRLRVESIMFRVFTTVFLTTATLLFIADIFFM
jgi:hypothetical protein